MNKANSTHSSGEGLDTRSLSTRLYLLAIKLIGVCFLGFAVWYWAKIIGLYDEALRFDTMQNHWKIASVSLAVLQPVVALGLWAAFPWGIAVWIIAALTEVIMFGLYDELFGTNDLLIAFHIFCAVVIISFHLLFRYELGRDRN